MNWRTSDNYPPIEWQDDDSGLWFAVPPMYIIFGVGKIKRGINRIRYRIYDIIPVGGIREEGK